MGKSLEISAEMVKVIVPQSSNAYSLPVGKPVTIHPELVSDTSETDTLKKMKYGRTTSAVVLLEFDGEKKEYPLTWLLNQGVYYDGIVKNAGTDLECVVTAGASLKEACMQTDGSLKFPETITVKSVAVRGTMVSQMNNSDQRKGYKEFYDKDFSEVVKGLSYAPILSKAQATQTFYQSRVCVFDKLN